MFPKSALFYARNAITSESWECRYAGLEMLLSCGETSDIPRVEACLVDKIACVRIAALRVLARLLAFESEPVIRQCLFDNDASDPYGSLEVRETARSTLDTILAHTRPQPVIHEAANS
jgi:hypothetical protein